MNWPGVTIADGYAARDRLIAKARCVMPEADLPGDLRAVAPPVFWWHEAPLAEGTRKLLVPCAMDEPQDLGNGWVGYEGGAAYNMSRDISEQDWWICERNPDKRKRAYRLRR